MFKKVLSLALVLLLTLNVACSGTSNTDQAKSVFSAFVAALKETDTDEMKKYVTEEFTDDMTDDEDDATAMKEALQRTQFTYKSGELAKDATEGTLKYDVEAVVLDFATMLNMSTDPSSVDIDALEMNTQEIDVTFVKEGEEWKVSNPTDVILYSVGMGGMSDFVDALD